MLTYLCESATKGKAFYRCHCGIGAEAFKNNVNSGHTRSCGCERARTTAERSRTHGHKAGGRRSTTYTVWVNMRARCNNPLAASFKDYGGRGITVCDKWASFEHFLADMGERPDGCTLDRIDNSKGYSAENCRWAPRSAQANNKRTVVLYPYDGERLSIAEIARRCGVDRPTLRHRIKRGVPLDVATSTKGFLKYRPA